MQAFLADECFAVFIVRALRDAGYDVVRSAETHPGADDDTVLALALSGGRVLLTEDTDFGELVIRLKRSTIGIVRVDLEGLDRPGRASRTLAALTQLGDEVRGALVTIQPTRTRVRKLT